MLDNGQPALATTHESVLGFPKGQDSAFFGDEGTEIPSFSPDKGTTGQANLPQDGTGQDSLSKSGIRTEQSLFVSYDYTCY